MSGGLINRKKFYDAVRKSPFGGHMAPGQVAGMEVVLNTWEKVYRVRTSVPQLAVILATDYHESGHTMQPVKEFGGTSYFMKMYDKTGARPKIAAALGNTEIGDGAKFPGMGYVQCTGRGNARKATKRMRELNLIGDDINFERNPEYLMLPKYAVHVLFLGMEEGWFTGQTLDKIVDDKIDGDEHADAVRSRKIVNGTDRAELIAGYATAFLNAIVASLDADAEVASPAKPVPDAKAAPHDVAGATAWNTFWTRVGELFPHHKA